MDGLICLIVESLNRLTEHPNKRFTDSTLAAITSPRIYISQVFGECKAFAAGILETQWRDKGEKREIASKNKI